MKRKIGETSTSRKKAKTCDSNQCADANPVLARIFHGLTFYIHPANFGVGRLRIFEKQVKKFGGQIIESLPHTCRDLTHVIFEESVDSERVKKLLNPDNFPNAVFLKCTWLSLCIKSKLRELIKDHEIIRTSTNSSTDRSEKDSDIVEKASVSGNVRVVDNVNIQADVSANIQAGVSYSNESDLGENGSKQMEDVRSSHTQFDCETVKSSEKTQVTEIEYRSVATCTKDVISSLQNQCDGSEKQKETATYNTDTEDRKSNDIQEVQEDNLENIKSHFRKPFPKYLQEKFVCSQPSSSQTKGFNAHITSELEKLAVAYKSKNDTWRAMGYQKAISAIRNHPKEITSREEALNIRGVGARLADKVAEIVESGKLRKVAEVCDGEEAQTLKLFMGVWGAGPTTAQSWYVQGFRTLEDLRTKASLSRHQQIGLKHYDDINTRIPRDEVTEIEDYVREAALSIKKGLIVNVCGSYRRGKPTCGDVDVLITHPDGHSHSYIFKPILQRLKDLAFLTDDLVTQEDNLNQKKYLGVCRLPGKDRKHRRLDIIVVPYAEYAPAMLYFTGSAHFNRSMRLLAIKMGMSLSEHGLRAGIIRQGREKLTAGCLLETPTEESIFKHLGLEYRSPQERDH